MEGTLFVIGTPIGNLGDISKRALETLGSVDLIACEDTRKSLKLLSAFNIQKKLVSNHKFNEKSKVSFFISKLLEGENIGLISDAGMPCVSDPGYILVKEAIENNINVVSIPGACAVTTSIASCGFDASTFSFLGFLPRDEKEMISIFNKIKASNLSNVFIFYESPKRILKTFKILSKEEFLDFKVCLCNDLTKKFEKIYRGSPSSILDALQENPSYEKGEYAIVIDTSNCQDKKENASLNSLQSQSLPFIQNISLEAQLIDCLVKNPSFTLKDAIKFVRDANPNLKKDDIFKAGVRLKERV